MTTTALAIAPQDSLQAQFQLYNPKCPPSWRFDRVMELLRHHPRPARPAPHDDDYIRQARRFVMDFRSCPQSKRMELFARNPGLYYAYSIHNDDEDEMTSCILQARLLARQSHEDIAHAMKTLPSTVTWYEKLFFNVKDRWEHKDWIVRQILGPAVERGLLHRDHDLTLKLFAFFGGPHVLDLVLTGFQQSGLAQTIEAAKAFVVAQVRDSLARRCAIEAAEGFTVNEFNVIDLFNAHAKFLELEQELGSGQARDQIEANIMQMIKEFQWKVGSQEQEGLPPLLLTADQGSVELSDKELLAAGRGEAPAQQTILEFQAAFAARVTQ